MGKKKAVIAVGLCVALGLCGGSLAACGNKGGGDNKPKAGDQSDYYLAGDFAYADYNAAEDGEPNFFNANATTKKEVFAPFAFKYTETENVYEVTVKLYSIDTFKVVKVGQSWSGQINADNTLYSDEDAIINSGDGYPGEHNFGIEANGEYKITLTINEEEGNTIASEKVGDVAALPVPVESVELNKTSIVLEFDYLETFQLEVTINPENADEKDTIYFDSDDEAVATVSDEGLITAVAKGETDITVECDGKSATCHVKVLDAGEGNHAETVVLNKETTALHVGEAETLTATVTPANTTDAVEWTSSAPAIVSVVDGKITALKPGTATVTVTYGMGSFEKTASCEVTVEKDLYLVGTGKTPVLTGFNTIAKHEDVPANVLLTKTGDDYSITADLDSGAEFQILTVGAEWNGQIGASALAAEDTETGVNLSSQVGGTSNIAIKADGQYKIDLKYNAENSEYSVEITRLGDATVEFPWEYDVVFHGGWGPAGDNGDPTWTGIKFGTASFDKDHLTATADIVLGAAGFGVKTSPAGTMDQAGWFNSDVMSCNASVTTITLTPGANATCTAAGTYNVTVTLNASGSIASIVFNSFTAAE